MRYLTFFLILFFLIGHFACENCASNVPESIALKDLSVLNLKDTDESEYPVFLKDNEEVFWDDLVLRFGFDYDFISQTKSNTAGYLFADCTSRGYKGTGYGIESVNIITLEDYNLEYVKGDTINENLNLYEWYRSKEIINTIEDFKTRYQTTFNPAVVELRLIQKPLETVEKIHFRIIITFKDSSTYVADNLPVPLKK